MIGSSIANRFKSLDVYRKLPSDLTESTMSGAIVSLIATIVMLFLFITELQGYMAVTENSQMFVDVRRGQDKIQVNIDIEFPHFPCDIFSLDAQDVMGTHMVNVEGNLQKFRVDGNGNKGEKVESEDKKHHDHGQHEAVHNHDQSDDMDYTRVQQAFVNHQGCRIIGYIKVNRVPGNFHISSHAFGHALNRIFAQSRLQTIDLSHKIHHLSFGESSDLTQIKQKFSGGVLNPLDNTKQIKPTELQNTGVMHQYYISIVPTTYVEIGGKQTFIYQFTANCNEVTTHHLPAVYFRYDLSPVTVQFSLEREGFFHFIVQICAIIGGVFTVAGIIDSVVHQSVVAILKKHEMGQLS